MSNSSKIILKLPRIVSILVLEKDKQNRRYKMLKKYETTNEKYFYKIVGVEPIDSVPICDIDWKNNQFLPGFRVHIKFNKLWPGFTHRFWLRYDKKGNLIREYCNFHVKNEKEAIKITEEWMETLSFRKAKNKKDLL